MIKSFLYKYKHGLMFLYAFIYLPWFLYLERTVVTNYHVIHMKLDDYIPFIEFFIVPYLLWFFYVAGTMLYFFFKNTKEFYRLSIFLFTGMTIFLIVSTLYPNGHHLRPTVFARDNIFVDAVKILYMSDTATNLFPSIHVFNSIVSHISISKNCFLRTKVLVQKSSFVIMISIVLSTVFLKQHTVFDVIIAIALVLVLYPIFYRHEFSFLLAKFRFSSTIFHS